MKEFRPSGDLPKRFRRSVILAMLFGLACLIISGYGFLLSRNVIVALPLLLMAVLQFGFAGLSVAIPQSMKLVLSPERLVFYGLGGLELTTSWDNVARIDQVLVANTQHDCLVLHAPPQQKIAWWFQWFRPKAEKTIPLSMFSDWRTTELGQALRQYAPHLF